LFASDHTERTAQSKYRCRSGSADVQRDAMGSPPNILECRKDYIKPPVFLRAVYTRLIAIKHDQIRIDAKCIHVDAVATNAFR
jgi:hypothetical protein